MDRLFLLLLGLAAGCAWGHWQGRRRGLRQGRAEGALGVRAAALESGRCPLCEKPVDTSGEAVG